MLRPYPLSLLFKAYPLIGRPVASKKAIFKRIECTFEDSVPGLLHQAAQEIQIMNG
jgi:hypothetical protein